MRSTGSTDSRKYPTSYIYGRLHIYTCTYALAHSRFHTYTYTYTYTYTDTYTYTCPT
ncbi:MAG: hypothetical protein VYE35_05650 [Chloroflexota bacterium]|nr:hypothetical protein [Chloroflexota bacterium]